MNHVERPVVSQQCIQSILNRDKKILEATLGLDAAGARIEVQCLLQEALGVKRAWLLTHADLPPEPEQYAHYQASFMRRVNGEPLCYILGERAFFELSFKVTPATLIPRPETELLVECALQRIPLHAAVRVLDLGTGSGVIAISLAHARPAAQVVAVDVSQEALEVARENACRLHIDNLHLLHSDWFAGLAGERFDLIVSNPPYIATDDAHLAQGDLRFEPHGALVSGSDGLDGIRHICAHAGRHLNAEGSLLFEHGYNQSEQVRDLLLSAGFGAVFSVRDLAGIERVSGGKK